MYIWKISPASSTYYFPLVYDLLRVGLQNLAYCRSLYLFELNANQVNDLTFFLKRLMFSVSFMKLVAIALLLVPKSFYNQH